MSTVITDNLYHGSGKVNMIMLNGERIYQGVTKSAPVPPEPEYDKMYLTVEALENGNFYVRNENFDFSKNGGAWTSGVGNQTIPLVTGDKVRFRYNANSSIRGRFSGNTMSFKVYGNLESMEYGDNFSGQTTVKLQDAFFFCFYNCSGLTDASNLILPATDLKNRCYYGMFEGCAGLGGAPQLPSISTRSSCYAYMFKDCVSLTTAPVLPATELISNCYYYMFSGCRNLHYIKCLALNASGNYTGTWVGNNVPQTGTFVKTAGAMWEIGNNGIPRGWTVIEEGDKLTLEDSDGGVYDGVQAIPPGVWGIQQTISNLASYTLYYGGEVVTADTHVTIINDGDSSTDFDSDETGMVWSDVTYGHGYGDSGTIDVTVNYSAQTGTAELFVHYYTDLPPDPCAGDPECECVNQGGTWNGTDCEFPDPCAGYSSQEECVCLMNGGIWDGENCEFPQPDDPQPEPDE